MNKLLFQLTAPLLLITGAFYAQAGTLSYQAIPAVQSDASCGISNANEYTSAVDGGNASGTDRVINGITLYSMVGSGQSVTTDNCTLNALAGTLTNANASPDGIQADGTFKDVLSDMTFNNDAADNSQQEIVLDPASLAAGTTYDLRVYICNAGGEDRQVNLSFVGDGQGAVETGFFNEDDARTSAGGFQDAGQVYYINYRYTWDGDSTPGITITQKSGQTPFILYALTNQPVAAGEAAAVPPLAGQEAAAPPSAAEGAGVSTGLVSAESDQVGVTTDTFYGNESLNKNGRWIEVKKYGRCWQPTGCPSGWRPYSRGGFRHCDDCGYTWVCDPSEEEWGWACYHYGRWCRVPGIGCGWAWTPGTTWSGAWVSWRQGQTDDCTCVGWAPLPPEATCRVGIGISTWVDRECDIGPDCYTFVNVRHFGSDSFEGCGCILERNRYVNILEHTVNITNISYTNINVTNVNVTNVNVTNVNIYNGGPNLNWCNTEIRKYGGKEISQIHVNHVSPEDLKGGKASQLQGNTLALLSPKVTPEKNPKFVPKVAATVPANKIDHGWNQVKDPKIKNELKNKIAEQSKGQTPQTTKATLPPDVAQKLKAHGSPSPAGGQSPSLGGKGVPGKLTLTSPAPGKSPVTGQSPALGGKGTPGKLTLTSPSGAQSPALGGKGKPGKLTLTSPAPGQSPALGGKGTGKLTLTSPVPGKSPVTGQSPATSPGQTQVGKGLKPGASIKTLGATSPGKSPIAGQSPKAGQSLSTGGGKGQHPGDKGAKTLTGQTTAAPGKSPGVAGASPPPLQKNLGQPSQTPKTAALQSPPPTGGHPGQKGGKTLAPQNLGAQGQQTATPPSGGQKFGTPMAKQTPTGTAAGGGQHPGKSGPVTSGATNLPGQIATATPQPTLAPLGKQKGPGQKTLQQPLGAQVTPTPPVKTHLTPQPQQAGKGQQLQTGPGLSTPTPAGPSQQQILQQQKLQQQQAQQKQLQQQQQLQQQNQAKQQQQLQQQKVLQQQQQQKQQQLQQQQQVQQQNQAKQQQQLQQQKVLQQQQQQKQQQLQQQQQVQQQKLMQQKQQQQQQLQQQNQARQQQQQQLQQQKLMQQKQLQQQQLQQQQLQQQRARKVPTPTPTPTPHR